jgi:hypothetical protein
MDNKIKKNNSNIEPKTFIENLRENIDTNDFITKTYPKMCGNKYVPSIMGKVDRIVVLGDIHGDFELTLKMLKIAKVINIEITENNKKKINWNGGKTHLIQIGDQIDRCRPHSGMTCENKNTTYNDEASDIRILKLFTRLNRQAIEVGGAVISLLGNHELMNAQGMLDYVSYKGLEEFNNYEDPINSNKKFNSGKEARAYAFKPGNEHGKHLGCYRHSAVIIGSNLFVHAGIVDGLLKEIGLDKTINEIDAKKSLELINMSIQMWLMGILDYKLVEKIIDYSDESMFWSRILGNIPKGTLLSEPSCYKNIDPVLKLFKIGSIHIGHTPQSFKDNESINGTCINNKNNTLWRVDNGSSSAFNNFDKDFIQNKIVKNSRRPQILEIINDSIFTVRDNEKY